MGKNATGQENLMLWVSTKCMSHGRKRDLSYGEGKLLGLYINKKMCIRSMAQKSIKTRCKAIFYPFSLKMALTYLEGVRFQAALKVCRQNWQTSALDGPAQSQERVTSQPPRTFHSSLKSHSRIKEQENPGKTLQFWVKNMGLKLKKKKVPLNLFP